MLQKPRDYDTAASYDSDFERLPVGGYVVEIKKMEETVTPCAPNKLVNKTVARDADTTLTIVLPINMVVKSFEKFSVSS